MVYIIKETQKRDAKCSTYSIAVTEDYNEAIKVYNDIINQITSDTEDDNHIITREEKSKSQWKFFIGYDDDFDNSTEVVVTIQDNMPKMEELPLTWAEDPNTKISGYYIDPSEPYSRKITEANDNENNEFNYDIYATVDEAKSSLAFARITQLMHNDHRYGGLITPDEWLDTQSIKYQIIRMWSGKLGIANTYSDYNYLSFHSEEQRDLFLKENKELIKDYLMIKE